MNKVFGAILGVLLFGFVLIEVSHMLYPNPRGGEHVDNPGYVVEGVTETGHGDDNGDSDEPVETVDLATLLANADPEAGAAQFRACGSCHNNEPGAGARIGPNLWGVVNRAIGAAEGFSYSRAMGEHGGNWTFENLNAFLESPSGFINGTSMSYRGMRREGQRADLIAYLATLSDTPIPLPTPSAAAAEDHSDMMDDHMEDAVEEMESADDAAGEAE